jgi:hypothetical protein
MEKTRSEHVFERFYHENSVRFSRVETESDTKTPDYDVFPQENRVIAEIKELQANDDDEAAWSEARTRGAAAAWSDPRNRIRQKIGVAVKQLKRRSEGLHPAIVVLFDNETFWRHRWTMKVRPVAASILRGRSWRRGSLC